MGTSSLLSRKWASSKTAMELWAHSSSQGESGESVLLGRRDVNSESAGVRTCQHPPPRGRPGGRSEFQMKVTGLGGGVVSGAVRATG